MAANDQTEGLLSPSRILDLTEGAAGFCARLLADLGASVIKVEPPGGEPARRIGPFPPEPVRQETSFSFLHHNHNKRGITLDVATAPGRDLFLKLAGGADVVVESFPPGRLAALGLGYDRLAEVNPRLILASLTGFGQEGPHSRYLSCGLVAAAMGGAMSVCGTPETPPLKPHGDQGAYAASLFAAVGILLALRRRAATGRGERLDISSQEATAATLDHVLVRYFGEGEAAGRRGDVSWNGASFILPCRDGRIQVHVAAQWETLVAWMASEGMAGELAGAAWQAEEYRRRHVDRLREVMAAWTRTHAMAELADLAQAMRFPWAPVAAPAEVPASPQLQARGFFGNDPGGDGAGPVCPGPPYRFTPPAAVRRKPAPGLGEDNLAVYGEELGLSGTEIERLAVEGVI